MLRSTADQDGNSEKIWKFGFSRNPNVKIIKQGVQLSCKVADILLKAPDVNGATRAPKAQAPRGVWGHAPPGNF